MKNILSDVDGTITKGSLVLDHACKLHRDGVISLGTLPDVWLKDRKDEGTVRELAELYRNKIVGMTLEQLDVPGFISMIVARGDFYSTLHRLQEGTARGDKVTLISGSPSYLVDALGAYYGFNTVGSDYLRDGDGRFTGKIVPMFTADAKRAQVTSMGLTGVIQAYGDTRADLPLFEVADWAVLVHPTSDTRKALKNNVNEIIYK